MSTIEQHKKFHARDLYSFLTFKLLSKVKNKIQSFDINHQGMKTYYSVSTKPFNQYFIPRKLDVLTGFSYEGMKIGDVIVYGSSIEKKLIQTIDTLPIQPFLISEVWLSLIQYSQEFWLNVINNDKKITVHGFNLDPILIKRLRQNRQFNVFFAHKNEPYLYICGRIFVVNDTIDNNYEPFKLQERTLKRICINSRRKRYNSIFINFY